MRKLVKVFLSIGVIALFSVNTQAAIYKCVDAKSKVYYIDKPCPKKAEETQFKAVKDPKNGYKPPAFVKDKVEKAKEGIVVGRRDSSNNPEAQDHSNSASINQKKGGGSSGSVGASSGAENNVNKSSSSNMSGGSKGQSSSNSSSNKRKNDDGRYDDEPLNIEELIPSPEEAVKQGLY